MAGLLLMQIFVIIATMGWYGSNVLKLVDNYFQSEFKKYLDIDKSSKSPGGKGLSEKMPRTTPYKSSSIRYDDDHRVSTQYTHADRNYQYHFSFRDEGGKQSYYKDYGKKAAGGKAPSSGRDWEVDDERFNSPGNQRGDGGNGGGSGSHILSSDFPSSYLHERGRMGRGNEKYYSHHHLNPRHHIRDDPSRTMKQDGNKDNDMNSDEKKQTYYYETEDDDDDGKPVLFTEFTPPKVVQSGSIHFKNFETPFLQEHLNLNKNGREESGGDEEDRNQKCTTGEIYGKGDWRIGFWVNDYDNDDDVCQAGPTIQ